ncbi:MAG: hypothetical protein JXO72_08145, partial [Vicinamibacteria bacterium]|nr:hypothetical protein [Vicinamibacteria bacterium]
RWQASVMALAPLLIGLIDLGQRRVSLRALLAGCGAALVAFSPQMIAWKLLYGQFLWIPRSYGGLLGRGAGQWFNPRSPRALDVLLSADRGLFTWTPVMLLLSVGLLLAIRRHRILASVGLLVFAATTWVNGSLSDWQSSDSFGARRFDLVIPFLALGLAQLLELGTRHPLGLSTIVLSLAVLWNIGAVSLKTRGILKTVAPLDRVASRQAKQLRGVSETWMQRLAGPRGRSLAYRFFVGEYFYWNTNPAGTINLADPECPYLAGGWSSSLNAAGRPTFRWALHPSACVRFPLDHPLFDMKASIRARAPTRLENQVMIVSLNGVVLRLSSLATDWTETEVVLPGRLLMSGQNRLCLSFDQAIERDGQKIAAAIAIIQLP